MELPVAVRTTPWIHGTRGWTDQWPPTEWISGNSLVVLSCRMDVHSVAVALRTKWLLTSYVATLLNSINSLAISVGPKAADLILWLSKKSFDKDNASKSTYHMARNRPKCTDNDSYLRNKPGKFLSIAELPESDMIMISLRQVAECVRGCSPRVVRLWHLFTAKSRNCYRSRSRWWSWTVPSVRIYNTWTTSQDIGDYVTSIFHRTIDGIFHKLDKSRPQNVKSNWKLGLEFSVCINPD